MEVGVLLVVLEPPHPVSANTASVIRTQRSGVALYWFLNVGTINYSFEMKLVGGLFNNYLQVNVSMVIAQIV